MIAPPALLALACSAGFHQEAGSQPPAARNLFAGFEAFELDNGLLVWFRRVPGDPNVLVCAGVAVGSDDDPVGREELAHFVEHMLFKGDAERSEQEIEREILDRGGSKNGLTYPDHSIYFVHLPREHGAFAVEWLWRRLRPRVMDPLVVAAERDPILLEIGARRRQLFDWIEALYLDPPLLRPPPFWEREFGLRTRERRDIDAFRSVHAIGPADLEVFYRAWYVPDRMLLLVAGDLERASLEAQLASTWGTLGGASQARRPARLRDPGVERRWYRWSSRSNVALNLSWRLFDLDADEVLDGVFLGNFLSRRLTHRLRRGEDKAVYSVSAGLTGRGPAAVFRIDAEVHARKLALARGVIEEELEALETESLGSDDFEREREALVEALRSGMTEVSGYLPWLQAWFHDTRVFSSFPDVQSAFARQTPGSVARFLREHLQPRSRMLSLTRPHPLSNLQRWAIFLVLAWLAVRAMRLALVRPIEMTRIRYVARLRVPVLYALAAGSVLLIGLAVVGRLAWFGWDVLRWRVLLSMDDLLAQELARAGALLLGVLGLGMLASRIPRKLLLFDDVLLVKSLAWSSRRLRPEDIESVRTARFAEIWLHLRRRRCLPLTLGILHPGVLLETRQGRSYFFAVRDRSELLSLLEEFRGAE